MPRYHHVLTHNEGGIETITINRPEKRNALNGLLISELSDALKRAEQGDCEVVILTGAGSAFCAGLDLDEMATMSARTEQERQDSSRDVGHLLRTLYNFSRPTIAAINGPAIAGGMALATFCDFTLSIPDAKLGYTEVRVGFIPAIVAHFLMRQIGEKKTRELLLTGRIIKAQEAVDLGLITRIVPEKDLIEESKKLAACLMRNSPEALRALKKILSLHSADRLNEELEVAIMANARQRGTEDLHEGVRAFLERRDPVWPSRAKHLAGSK
jgi:methylglutaconyl-CoA hydratase